MESVAGEKARLSSIRQHTAAWLLGIFPSQLSISDAPRNADKSYDAKALVAWYIQHLIKQASPRVTDGDDPLLAGGPDSAGLERCRIAKAQLLELELAERRKQLHSRETVRDMLARIAARFKRIGETIARRYGNEAGLVIREALIESQRDVDDTIGGNGHFHDSTDRPTNAP